MKLKDKFGKLLADVGDTESQSLSFLGCRQTWYKVLKSSVSTRDCHMYVQITIPCTHNTYGKTERDGKFCGTQRDQR